MGVKKYTAFFDLDHTILNINSGEALLKEAYKKRLLSFRKLVIAYGMALLYKLRMLEPLKILTKLADLIASVPVHEFETLCREIAEKNLIPAIRSGIIKEIDYHREQGADLVILSSAILSLCSPVAEYLKMDSVICSEMEELDGHYTGRPLGKFCFREEKLNRLDEFLQSSDHTREDSYYYGDSLDDIPVLEAVGNPVCVNPGRMLRKVAREYGWKVRSW